MEGSLTTQEAAHELGCHQDHLYRLLKSGVAKGELFNRVWMIDPADVERIKAQQGPGRRLPKRAQKQP